MNRFLRICFLFLALLLVKAQNISFLSFGEWLAVNKMNVDEIRSLYFNGSGHFTPRGHSLCAQAVFDSFYANAHQ